MSDKAFCLMLFLIFVVGVALTGCAPNYYECRRQGGQPDACLDTSGGRL